MNCSTANPGVWEIGLREGRTPEVMDIDINKTKSDDALIVHSDDDDKFKLMVVLNSFTRPPFTLITKHKAGMEKEELLPQLSEEQIEAEEQRRLKEKMKKQKKKKQKRKSKQPESESSNQDSTGSIFTKLKNLVLGDDKPEDSTPETDDIETEDEDDDDEVENVLSSMFGRQRQETYIAPTPQVRVDAKPDEDTTIHIMSVASGHLYERFLKV